MPHHHARDGYETVKIPETYRPLLRRLQRGTWTQDQLEWVLRQHADLPPTVAALVREKRATLKS